ncbi:MAG: hypothetical protein WDO73_15455 [Ignavibacteriota bacterium]
MSSIEDPASSEQAPTEKNIELNPKMETIAIASKAAAISGLWKPEDYRDKLAVTAAALDHEAGRDWRPLEDTAVAAQFLYEAGNDYADYRRGVDFYPEGMMLWLDVDVTIRQLSRGKKNARRFLPHFSWRPRWRSGVAALRFRRCGDCLECRPTRRLGVLPQ